MDKDIGRIAFETYINIFRAQFDEAVRDKWENCNDLDKTAWRAVATAVLEYNAQEELSRMLIDKP